MLHVTIKQLTSTGHRTWSRFWTPVQLALFEREVFSGTYGRIWFHARPATLGDLDE